MASLKIDIVQTLSYFSGFFIHYPMVIVHMVIVILKKQHTLSN